MFSVYRHLKKRLFFFICLSATLWYLTPPASAASQQWVDSWATATVSGGVQPGFYNITIRDIVHLDTGGNRLRLKLSNVFNKEDLEIGAVHVALESKGPAIQAKTDMQVTFNGNRAVTIPGRSVLLSDPIAMKVEDASDLIISIYLPPARQSHAKPSTPPNISDKGTTPSEPPTWITWHADARQTNYIAPGDQVSSPTLVHAKAMGSWYFLDSVEVQGSKDRRTVVALGDSITDGYCSSPGLNHRYPDYLADRLRAHKIRVAVVNRGIGGNRLLREGYGPSALARFDRDVLATPGVRYVILLEGINDIGTPGMTHQPKEQVTAEQIEAGMLQIAERAHEHDIKIMAATMTPFKGSIPGYYSATNEQIRQEVNSWIRSSTVFDAVVDFDKALSDAHSSMIPELGCGDHLHPNDKGYKTMADSINLSFFKH